MASVIVSATVHYLRTILTPEQLRELRAELCSDCWQFILRKVDSHLMVGLIVQAPTAEEAMLRALLSWNLIGFIVTHCELSALTSELAELRHVYASFTDKSKPEISAAMSAKFGTSSLYTERILALLLAQERRVFLIDIDNNLSRLLR